MAQSGFGILGIEGFLVDSFFEMISAQYELFYAKIQAYDYSTDKKVRKCNVDSYFSDFYNSKSDLEFDLMRTHQD